MTQHSFRLVEYDRLRRRLWIFGQRCHHGAAGTLVAAAACLGMIADPPVTDSTPPVLPLIAAAAGGALMVHDWKDKAIWFERGYGTQP